MNPRRLLGGFAAAFLSLAATGARAQTATSLDAKVQAPELKAPERGSMAGQLATMVFGPADVSRGAFALPSPFAAPSERGAVRAEVFPTYSLDHPISEWGLGWSPALAMTRFRITGDIDYRTDELAGPFGRLLTGTDGYWYPQGMAKAIRVAWSGDSIAAVLPDGTRMTFGGAGRVVSVPGKGIYAWYLASVETATGQRTRLDYQANASGRLFLTSAWYGGHGDDFQHRIDVEYEALPVPFKDYAAGVQILLDRRVKRVAALSKHAVTGLFAERWHYDLAYADDGLGPAFYLSNVQQEFASGERPPPTTYQYHLGKEALAAASFVENPKLMPVLSAFQADVIQADKSAVLDLDQDGMPDLERAYDQQLIRQTDAGWSYEPLPWANGTYSLCRPGPNTANPPRALASLRASEDATHVVSLVYDRARMLTAFTACDRSGVKLSTQVLPNDWSLSGTTRLADLNRDRQPDLVRVFQGGFQVLPNTSTPAAFSFGAMKSGALSPSVAPAASWVHDFNGDGIADLVARTSGSLVVWYGKGNLEFEQAGQSFVFQTLYGPLLLSDYSITFVDSNKDGLTDVLLTKAVGNATYLFVNRGTALLQAAVPGLAAVDQSASKPVAADFSGSGNTELAYVKLGRAFAVALDAPSTGLLQTADDGKGTALRFEYSRARPAPGARSRQTVLSKLTVESSGDVPMAYAFTYQGPRAHSLGKFLLGFDQVTRTDPVMTSSGTFLNEDRYSGILLGTVKRDALAPAVEAFETRAYEDAVFQGVPWKRLKQEISGYRDAAGATLSERTDYVSYVDDLCPHVVQHTSAAGLLTTTHGYAKIASFGPALSCLASTTVEQGSHSDPRLDFRHETALTRNSVGLVEKVESADGRDRLVLQTAAYRPADWLVESVSSPGKGASSFVYDAVARRLQRATMPEELVVEASARDPMHDAILSLSARRGSLASAQFFRFDGLERLSAAWDDQGASSEQTPASRYAYRYATASEPAAQYVSQLIDFDRSSVRETASLFTAAGEPVVAAARIPEGWAFERLTARTRAAAKSETYLRPTLATPADPLVLDFPALLAGASRVGSETRSPLFDDAIESRTTFHSGVERQVAKDLKLSDGLLRVVTTENGTYSTVAWRDSGKRLVVYDDEAGARYGYTYDALGRLREVALPDGNRHRVAYDGHGRIWRVERSDLASVETRFDATTGLISRKDFYSPENALVRSVVFFRDAIGRVTLEKHVDAATGAERQFSYFFDGATPAAPDKRDQLGLLTAVSGPDFAKLFEYRGDGLLIRRTISLADWRKVETSFTYLESGTLGGRAVKVFDAGGALLSSSARTFVYGAHGRLVSVLQDGAELASFGYDENGQLALAGFASGDLLAISYDPLSRRFVGSALMAADHAASTTQRMGARGLVDLETFSAGATTLTRAYSYSAQRFLESATDSEENYEYRFDPFGLPTLIGRNGAARPLARSGSALTAGGVTYQFDELGRTVSRSAPALEVTYGPDGQIATAATPSGKWRYIHDEAGQRLLKLSGCGPVAAYLEEGYLDASGLTERVEAAGRTAGIVKDGVFSALAVDARGSVIAEPTGIARIASPFGQRDVHPSAAAAIDYVEKGFDADLGWVRMGVRDYDPEINRFTTPDPLFLEAPEKCAGSPVECNLYSYAQNGPTNAVDPTGREAEGELVDSLGLGEGGQCTGSATESLAGADSGDSALQSQMPNESVPSTGAAGPPLKDDGSGGREEDWWTGAPRDSGGPFSWAGPPHLPPGEAPPEKAPVHIPDGPTSQDRLFVPWWKDPIPRLEQGDSRPIPMVQPPLDSRTQLEKMADAFRERKARLDSAKDLMETAIRIRAGGRGVETPRGLGPRGPVIMGPPVSGR